MKVRVRYRDLSVEEALEMEDLLHEAAGLRSLRKELNRKLGSYNDRNDGFERTWFSRSKNNFSRIRKIGKVNKKRAAQAKMLPSVRGIVSQ